MSRYYTHGGGRQDTDEAELVDRTGGYGGVGGYGGAGGYSSGGSAMKPLRSNEYYEPYDERDQGFDIRADFDGDGPRWSETYGVAKQETYRPVYDHVPPTGVGAMQPVREEADPEMVSVPVLGPEWRKDELHDISRRGKADIKRDDRDTKYKAWSRGQRGCCGIRWLTRNVFVFIAFFFIAGLIVCLYFVIPREVTFKFYEPQPFMAENSTIYFSRQNPTNFTFEANLQLMADASSSYIPVQFSNAEATVINSDTLKVIATGKLGKKKIQNKRDQPVTFPVTFDYAAFNMSDATWNDMYNACQYPFTGVQRGDLKFRLEIKQHIVGMVKKPVSTSMLGGITCPFDIDKSV